jgi:hypothetical protein
VKPTISQPKAPQDEVKRPKPKPRKPVQPNYIPPSDSDEPLESYGDPDAQCGHAPSDYEYGEYGAANKYDVADLSAQMDLMDVDESAHDDRPVHRTSTHQPNVPKVCGLLVCGILLINNYVSDRR